MKAEPSNGKCHRCDRFATCYAYADGRDVPLCLYCRLELLKAELERRGAKLELLASFPRRWLTATTPAGAEKSFENLKLTNDTLRDLDIQNLEVLEWAVALLRSELGMVSTGDRLCGLAGTVVRSELPKSKKNAAIETLGVLALDRVMLRLFQACPRRY